MVNPAIISLTCLDGLELEFELTFRGMMLLENKAFKAGKVKNDDFAKAINAINMVISGYQYNLTMNCYFLYGCYVIRELLSGREPSMDVNAFADKLGSNWPVIEEAVRYLADPKQRTDSEVPSK